MSRRLRAVACAALCAGAAVAALTSSCSLIYSTNEFDTREASAGDVMGSDAGDGGSDVVTGCDTGAPDPRYLEDAVEISLGGLYSCALREGGSVVCWGNDGFLQLGSPRDGGFSTAPVPIDDVPPAVHLSTGEKHACVSTIDGGAYCWGDNAYGEVGSGLDAAPSQPKVVLAKDGVPLSYVTTVASGFGHSCGIVDGVVYCWGDDTWDQTGTGGSTTRAEVSKLLFGATAIATGWCQSCAIVDGGVKCWGSNQGCYASSSTSDASIPTPGVLGVPGASQTETPLKFKIASAGGRAAMQVVAGPFDTCAIDAMHNVYCSGSNEYGEIGSAVPPVVQSPLLVTDFADSGPTELALGPYHSCILTRGTRVACVGDNSTGELGVGVSDPPDSAPRPLSLVVWGDGGSLAGASAIAAGGISVTAGFIAAHSCAIVKRAACATSGTVVCWGANAYGQLGDGTTTDRAYPAPVLAPAR